MKTRYEKLKKEQTYGLLRENPDLQLFAIAHHYTKLASLAQELQGILRVVGKSEGGNSDQVIERMVSEIKKHHLEDFGIELEWSVDEF